MRRLRLAFRQRPRASSARLPFATRGSAGLLLQSGDPQWQGGLDPSRRDSRATTVRLFARLLPGRPRGIGKVRGDRLPSRVRPHRCGISDMAYGALRGASPRPLRYDRGVARRSRCSAPGPGFPDRRRIAPARPASRTTGFPRPRPYRYGVAELLRRAQVALDFRVAPARPS